jgi:hypothetical protein
MHDVGMECTRFMNYRLLILSIIQSQFAKLLGDYRYANSIIIIHEFECLIENCWVTTNGIRVIHPPTTQFADPKPDNDTKGRQSCMISTFPPSHASLLLRYAG